MQVGLLLVLSTRLQATHLVGADISYRHITGNTYQVELTFYRDCLGSRPPAGVGIEFVSENCHRSFTDTLLRVAGTGNEITYPCPSASTVCSDPASTTPGIQEYRYSKLVTLPSRCSDWVFSWSYCCRNCDITTLQTPQPCTVGSNPGMYVSATLNNLDYDYNNSPQFTNVPITFVCIGQDFIFNHGVVDQDGDSLVYQLVAPRSSATAEIPYLPGYSATSPITSNPPLQMNSSTGDIIMTPQVPEVSVLSVMVSEYRNGILIGTVVRDMAVYVRPCNNSIPELSGINGSLNRDTVICPGTALCFDIHSFDTDAGQQLSLQWNEGITGADFRVTGGSRPDATFCWTPGSGDARTAPYTFTVTVVDDACPMSAYQTFSYSIVVRDPDLQVSVTDAACHGGSDGALNILFASPGFDIQWSTGQQNSTSLSGLSAGTYDITLHDPGSGCSLTRSFNISEPPTSIVVVTDNLRPVTCNGESNGMAEISVTGGSGGYSFEWLRLPDTAHVIAASSMVTSASAGDYIVRVTDATGCTVNHAVQIAEPLPILLTGASVPATCGASDGTAAVNVAGGVPGYSYDWGSGFGANSTHTGVPAGAYAVTVLDANGCGAVATVTVSNLNIPIPTVIALADVSCYGRSDGKAVVIPQGGTPPFSYSWNTVPSSNTDTAYGLAPGTYTASIIDANGCQAFNSVTISEPVPMDISVRVNMPTCNGAQDGSINIGSVSGGMPPYAYEWVNSSETSEVLSQLEAGVYAFTVTDVNGCTYSGQSVLQDPAPIELSLDHVLTPVCHGGSDGAVSVSVSGGTGAVALSWSVNGSVSGELTGIPAGIYTVTAIDVNGCSTEMRVTVPDPPQPVAMAGANQVVCEGDAVSLSAQLQSGMTGEWTSSDPGIVLTAPSSPNCVMTGLSLGLNSVTWTVTDIRGCKASTDLQVRYFGGVQAAAGSDSSFCGSIGLLLSANLPEGMTGTWTSMNGAVFSDPNDPAAIVNIVNRGNDTLRWTLTSGDCEKSAYMVVVSRECGFELPTGYTPNSDGKNDGYEIKGLSEYPRNVLRVFNRWGNEVYSQKDYRNNEWTGQNDAGDRLPDGTYFVIFEAVGRDFHASSYVELRR
ncbi:MAG: hypothetical protein RL213_1885 [Bacteroidota bacterium]